MNFKVIKTENCFADSETYEYILPVTGEIMLSYLENWDTRINRKLRRPTRPPWQRPSLNYQGRH